VKLNMKCPPCEFLQHGGGVCCRVLRLRDGDALDLCDGEGAIARAELRGIAHNNRAYVSTTGPVNKVSSPRSFSMCPSETPGIFGASG
jgi:hypothetical protein